MITVAVTFGLFFAPLYYRSGDLYIDGIGQVDTMGEAFLVSALGLLTGFITLPLVGLFTKFWRGFAALMLGGAEYDAKSSRQFVRVGGSAFFDDFDEDGEEEQLKRVWGEELEEAHLAKPKRD